MIMGVLPAGDGRTNPKTPTPPTRDTAWSSGPPACHAPRPAHSNKTSAKRSSGQPCGQAAQPAHTARPPGISPSPWWPPAHPRRAVASPRRSRLPRRYQLRRHSAYGQDR